MDAISHWVLVSEWHVTGDTAAATACRQTIPPGTPNQLIHTGPDATPVCTTCSVRAPLSGDLTPRESADYMQLDAIQRGVYTRLPPSQRALYAKRQASRARATALAAAETGARSIIHTSRSVHTVNGGLPGHGKRY